jgi:hypothetical protein
MSRSVRLRESFKKDKEVRLHLAALIDNRDGRHCWSELILMPMRKGLSFMLTVMSSGPQRLITPAILLLLMSMRMREDNGRAGRVVRFVLDTKRARSEERRDRSGRVESGLL